MKKVNRDIYILEQSDKTWIIATVEYSPKGGAQVDGPNMSNYYSHFRNPKYIFKSDFNLKIIHHIPENLSGDIHERVRKHNDKINKI